MRKIKATVDVDIEEALGSLNTVDMSIVLSEHISDISDDSVLIEELESRGYKVEKEEQ